MKKSFMIVILLVILTIIGYLTAYAVRPESSAPLEAYVHEVGVECDGAYIVRDETVYYAPSAGIVYNSVSEGERAASGTAISAIYSGDVDQTALLKLRTIDRRIALLRENGASSGVYSSDETTTENDVSAMMDEVITLESDDNTELIHTYREKINALRSGSEIDNSEALAALEAEKESVEASAAWQKDEIISDRAGIFTSYTDGLETMLTPDTAKTCTPDYIRSLTAIQSGYSDRAAAAVGDAVCKVMNNHVWYIMGIVPTEQSEPFIENTSVTVRFANLSGAETSGKLVYISDSDDSGDRAFLIEVQTYLESAFSYRNADTDIIFESNEGYKVPQEAVHTDSETGVTYVNAAQGSKTYKCLCDIIYTDEAGGYSIVKSTEDAENRLASMDRVILTPER